MAKPSSKTTEDAPSAPERARRIDRAPVVASGAEEKPPFSPIKQSRVFEQVCDEIRKKLARGEYVPGDRLPPERELALMLGVSRQGLREALRMLENAGLVSLRKGPRGGAFIQQGNPEVVAQSMSDLMHLGHISLRDVLEARAIITTSVLDLACERGTADDFDQIESTLHRATEARLSGDIYETISAGAQFYRSLASATHNKVLIILVNALSEILRQVLVPLGTGQNQEVWDLRWKILASMRARNKARARRELHALFSILETIYSEREAKRAMDMSRRSARAAAA